MKNNLIQEIVVSVILIALLVLCLNPFNFWMPDTVVMMIVIGLVVVFTIFSGFIWKEHAHDEREMLHRMLAGRIAYLAGVGTLLLGVILETLKHRLDPWLVITLGVMIFAKIFGIIYSQNRH